MTDSTEIAEVSRRLNIVIALLLRSLPSAGESISLREQIHLLSDLGVRPKDIAEILGRTQAYVGKELSSLRKGKAVRR